MRALLDTHILLWALGDVSKLSSRVTELLEDESNEILVSVISGIEISIKKGLGKLETPGPLLPALESAGFTACTFSFAMSEQLESLPQHHRDPFDRMLIAFALVEGVPLVTCDSAIQQYAIQTIW